MFKEKGEGEASDGLRYDSRFATLLLDSYQRVVGRPMCERAWTTDREAAEWLYTRAPFGLLVHDTSPVPVFVYANRTALARFAYTWEEFIGLPSRLSAQPGAQQDRDAYLRRVSQYGYATGYRGMRVTKDGRRFWIENVTTWNLTDADGSRHGQATVVRSWADEDPGPARAG
ncbi:MEKHLA domain-containing protein [Streptomyces gamaensis]|uniref:MEKHLA domain-containing protein n=1 Tax=Streptomyces gamaensis TaxID=1763542 RepID=A0ABW0Z822_9ACTN